MGGWQHKLWLLPQRITKIWQASEKPNEKLSVYLPEIVIRETVRLLKSYGLKDQSHEGIVYWAGVVFNERRIITTVLAPQASTTAGSYLTSAVTNARVVTKVNEFRLHILAQVHSHPSNWVGHSDGDNKGAFMPYPGFYSVVVPQYGLHGMLPLSKCGIHEYVENSFVRLSPQESLQRFVVVPSAIDLRLNPGWKHDT